MGEWREKMGEYGENGERRWDWERLSGRGFGAKKLSQLVTTLRLGHCIWAPWGYGCNMQLARKVDFVSYKEGLCGELFEHVVFAEAMPLTCQALTSPTPNRCMQRDIREMTRNDSA